LAELFKNFQFQFGEVRSFVSTTNPDVIYFDPMYSQDKSKAMPGREMQILREVLNEDQDAQEQAKFLKEKASKKFVVKRSIKASELLEGVKEKVEGSSTRFDIYY